MPFKTRVLEVLIKFEDGLITRDEALAEILAIIEDDSPM